uniref:DNA-directed RNA polymerase n=1 Tax=viral metagenome TaxID=1070528 RepID=A0A6C0H459_9ZZZZ
MTDFENKKPSKIIGIQFSILSPYEIQKGSVVEITSRDTHINNKPVLGGLFDPRMGVLDPGMICPTDGLDYVQTPGYFGHINLSRPVYYIQYLSTIMKICRCVCIKCSKLLIDKEKYNYLLKSNAETRWNKVFSLASKKHRCGEDSQNGCGCLQPKIRKEGLATIIAEWNDKEEEFNNYDFKKEDTKMTMKIIPEMMLKIFKKISDEDVNFMGFSPIWSRPEWMICQVLAVPPPQVRPSIKHDAQQRSEDDLTHIIINIIKANKMLQEKIEQNSASNVIDDWTTVLQYYIATLVDNKIPGVAAVAQRSGRPLKAIKERLNGKSGRVRGNLMGKRVDFSARSVITPDPNLSISQLGVPLKVAKNLTKPVVVTSKNINYLRKLILNGPDEHPGAKIYERKNGDCISLRYVDRDSINLELGDIVHRHMLDGDAILFNRQPTLHRMSMMCHIAKIMYKGDTFRMNVADTKPYNADFDGDEMNLHMPQDDESEIELKTLAAVKYQIISPANNKSIVGIFQDSLLSSYLFTREAINFNSRTAMNLMAHLKTIDLKKINFDEESHSSFSLLSQIIPNISLKYKTKQYSETEDYSKSNNVLEINKGTIKRGHIEKSILGDTTRGLIHRIYNDYDVDAACDFINNLQDIVTEYMKVHGYSVGISDLIADKETNDKINETINKKKIEVKSLIDETHLGIFENKTGRSNLEEFETRINNILNKASFEAGKLGRQNLNSTNRFVIMVNAGSKGSDLNISQMISCLGQQNVDGKRIPYGFEDRTLPHYTKYDDSPNARGFVENSFIGGLNPDELFFHAMGGRVGLIDTACKTSQTGYIQRRLIKGLEDLMVHYDMTVRNNKNKIIQFSYGDDNFDPVRVESQQVPFVNMTIEEIYGHYQMPNDYSKDSLYGTLYTKQAYSKFKRQKPELDKKCKYYIDFILKARDEVIAKIFNRLYKPSVNVPVSFTHIINNIAGNQEENVIIDITPLEVFEIIETNFEKLNMLNYCKPNELFKVLYYYYLSPKELLMHKRLTRKSVDILITIINNAYKKALVAPGEMVGMIAAQSIGEPTTQLTLNTFHFAGVASKSNVTRGVPRIEEILSLSDNPKSVSCTIYLNKLSCYDQNKTKEYISKIENTKLRSLVESIEICFDPDDLNTLMSEDVDLMKEYNEFEKLLDDCNSSYDSSKDKSKWIIRMYMNKIEMLDKNISMDDLHFALMNSYNNLTCMYTDYNSEKLIFRIRINKNLQLLKKKKNKNVLESLDQSDEIYLLRNLQEELLDNLILRGVKNIDKVTLRKISDNFEENDTKYIKKDLWVLDTLGTNLLDILALDFVDKTRTTSNHIIEIYNTFGIEAARQSIFDEFSEVIEFDSTYINYHHLIMLADRMTCNDKMVSIFRHGINNDDIGAIAKASFEETPEMFLKAAKHGELDNMKGVSANIMCGQQGYYGTNCFKVLIDNEFLMSIKPQAPTVEENIGSDEQSLLNQISSETNNECSTNSLLIESSVASIKSINNGTSNDYELDF